MHTFQHCLQWYKLVLRTRLPTTAVLEVILQQEAQLSLR